MSVFKNKTFTTFWHDMVLFLFPIITLVGGIALAATMEWKWTPMAVGFIGSLIYWRLLDSFKVDRSEFDETTE